MFVLLLIVSTLAVHSGVQCHGPLVGSRYRYQYATEQILNNADQLEPAGFGAQAVVLVENLWQSKHLYLTRFAFEGFHYKIRVGSSTSRFKDGPPVENWPPVLVAIDGQTGLAQHLYMPVTERKHSVEPTQLNLVVALLNTLRTKFGQHESFTTLADGRHILRTSNTVPAKRESILAPKIVNKWEISSHLAGDHDYVELASGWQNVSIESRLYPSAHSILSVNYKLKLLKEESSSDYLAYKSLASLSEVLEHYSHSSKQEYRQMPVHLVGEERPCSPSFCHKQLAQIVADNRASLAEGTSLATVRHGVGYLKLMNYIRVNADRLKQQEFEDLLKKYAANRAKDGNVYITLLDVIAGSRHSAGLLAALDRLDLPKCSGDAVDACERFLVELGVSALSSSSTATPSSMVEWQVLSGEGLIELLVPMMNIRKWSDERVKHSFALTLATLVDAAVRLEEQIEATLALTEVVKPFHSDHHSSLDHASALKRIEPLSEKIIKYLISELDHCKDTDCRIVYLLALGNARILSRYGAFQALRKHAIQTGAREQVAALKALRATLEREWPRKATDTKFANRVQHLLIRVLYDSSIESTARLIAAEILANIVDVDGQMIAKLVEHLHRFPAELATMIWKRAVTVVASRAKGVEHLSRVKTYKDWSARAKVLNGSSDAFAYVMGETTDVEARYGVMLELLKGKLPKETAFNVQLAPKTADSVGQEVINVGLFARGLSSFAGGDDADGQAGNAHENEEEANEVEGDDSTMAGVALQVLGTQLRPYLFFQSTGELMGHVWSGTGSESTPVFRSNLLLADYFDVVPLINGFLVEQRLKGMFSLDLKGEVQISIWSRNSHSNVQTVGAMLFQGGQEIFTSDPLTSARKHFAIGGETSMDFVTDFDFYSSPYRICIQITTPDFVFRHNNRKYEQVHSEDMHRRLHRRSYRIAGKSYVLNEDNSRMCRAMNEETL